MNIGTFSDAGLLADTPAVKRRGWRWTCPRRTEFRGNSLTHNSPQVWSDYRSDFGKFAVSGPQSW